MLRNESYTYSTTNSESAVRAIHESVRVSGVARGTDPIGGVKMME